MVQIGHFSVTLFTKNENKAEGIYPQPLSKNQSEQESVKLKGSS